MAALQIDVLVALTMDEIMPRPKSGLLSRMMRLAPTNCLAGDPTEQPRFCIRPGAQYLVGVHVLNAPGASTCYESWRLKLHSPTGQAMALSLSKSQLRGAVNHASAEWDPEHLIPAMHAARSSPQVPGSADLLQHVSMEAEVGLGNAAAPTDPSGRWALRIPVQIAWSDR